MYPAEQPAKGSLLLAKFKSFGLSQQEAAAVQLVTASRYETAMSSSYTAMSFS